MDDMTDLRRAEGAAGMNHDEPIRPEYLPSDRAIRDLIGRRNRAFRTAQREERLADWADENFEGSAADALENRLDAARNRQEVRRFDAELDRLGYDPADIRWGQSRR